jgi:hypothetical protein
VRMMIQNKQFFQNMIGEANDINASAVKLFAGMDGSKTVKEFNRSDYSYQSLMKNNRKQRGTFKHNEVITQAIGQSFGKLTNY